MTEQDVNLVYQLSPLELGLQLKNCVQEIQRLEAVIHTLQKEENTDLSRDIIEALNGEIRRNTDQLILIRLRIKGRTLDQVVSNLKPG